MEIPAMAKTPFASIRSSVTTDLVALAIKAGWPKQQVDALRASLLSTSAKQADNRYQSWKMR
jgi:hypothetical protein